MTYIKPCRGCPLRHGCEQREDFRRRVRELGGLARTVRFKCPKLGAEIRPGRRIIIRQPHRVPGAWDDDWGISSEPLPATIVWVYPDHSFSATVDKAPFMALFDRQIDTTDIDDWEKRRFRKRQAHYRIIQFLDEPDRTVCALGCVGGRAACEPRGGTCECAAQEREWRDDF